MKMIRSIAFTFALLVLAAVAAAQTNVQNVPQSVQMRIFNAVSTAQCGTVTQNVGQNVHLVSYFISAATLRVRLRLEASNDGTNFFAISRTDGINGSVAQMTGGSLFAFGYFPVLRVCILEINGAGTLTVHYSGTSSTNAPSGQFNPSYEFVRDIALSFDASQNWPFVVIPPFGNSGGTLIFSGQAPGGVGGIGVGCTLAVQSTYGSGGSPITLANITLDNTQQVQFISIPAGPSIQLNLTYATCGGTAATARFSLQYVFTPTYTPTAFIGAVNSAAVAANIVPVLEGDFRCSQSAVVTIPGAGTIKPIAEVAGQRVRICHFSVALAGATNLQFVTGTGATCGTGTANLTGNYTNITALNLTLNSDGALRAPASAGVCIVTSGAVAGGGVITFGVF